MKLGHAKLAVLGLLLLPSACASQTNLQKLQASNAPTVISGGVMIEVAPRVADVIPVKITVPDFSGRLYRDDAYAVASTGQKIPPMEPAQAIALVGTEPLAKAIVAESEAASAGRAIAGQSLEDLRDARIVPPSVFPSPTPASGGLTIAGMLIGNTIYYSLNPEALKAAQIEDWSLSAHREDKTFFCPNRCYVYFPAGTYKSFAIAVKTHVFGDPELMTTQWPTSAPFPHP